MEKKTFNNLNLDVYEETLPNGLRIFLCPMSRHEVAAQMTVLFGGSVLEFELNGKNIKVPAGIAHFLEHKMFEKEDGTDPLKIYESTGAYANAFTSPYITAYHFEGGDDFFKNLQNLLDTAHKPYFTDENVLKEKGIISQEKKNTMDQPKSIVYDKSNENLFHNSYFKHSVLGSLEDINSITKEMLYDCYNAFYHPSNMYLTITGGFDINQTLDFIKKYYQKLGLSYQKPPVKITKQEPETVFKDKEIVHRNTENKEILISYKVKPPKKSRIITDLYFSLLLNLKFSEISDFPDITFNDENIITDVGCSFYTADDYYIINVGVTVKEDTDKIISLIDKAINDKTYSEKEFNLIKKVLLSSVILLTEKVSRTRDSIASDVYLYGNVNYDIYNTYKNISYDEFQTFVNNLNFNNKTITIVEKNQ